MNTEQKQAEMDWAFADRECTQILNCMAVTGMSNQNYGKLESKLDAAKAKRREAGDRINAASMAELARRRGELVLSTENTERENVVKFAADVVAYRQGAIARKKGVVVGDNPYSELDDDFWFWTCGWLDGVPPLATSDSRLATNPKGSV